VIGTIEFKRQQLRSGEPFPVLKTHTEIRKGGLMNFLVNQDPISPYAMNLEYKTKKSVPANP
jgi:hypothetical protein